MTKTKIIAILNLTPDSFSDGGLYDNLSLALKHLENMIQQGADVIDIGAESTRPGAIPINSDQEWQRLLPILAELKNVIAKHPVELSIDTRHPENIIKAVDYGFDIINDVSGFANDKLQDLVIRHSDAKIVLMHNLGVPASKKLVMDKNLDPVAVIKAWAKDRISALIDKGLPLSRIIFDPGIGFGKTAEQSLKIMREIQQFAELNTNILVGHSRKSFFSLFNSHMSTERDLETYIASTYLSLNGVNYLRVHDVAGNRRAIDTAKYFWE